MASDPSATGGAPRLDDLLDPERALESDTISYGLRQCRHGPMLFNRRDLYIGCSLEAYGEFSEGEIIVLSQLLRPGAVIVEAGSNIGAHTVPLARIAGPSGFVYAFEPQRLAFQLLCANVALNALANVSACCEALGRATGTAHVPQLRPDIEQNFGGVAIEHQAAGEKVPVTTIDSLGLKRLNLVKADVEGMEQSVLEGGRETIERLRPILYLENDRRDHSPALIRLIESLGYRAWWHSPPMYNPHNFFGTTRDLLPGAISLNLLALPADRRAEINLEPVAGPDHWPIP
ncbi:MAG: FkbM family methyltransferase [Rhodospirillaceae bacterium]|nr:FkbM family methyltransferase [Rhodospirillaceae bacterium]